MTGSSPHAARRRGLAVAALTLMSLALSCGGGTFDPAHLQAQGEAGQRALDLLAAHGGMDGFLALQDLEYRAEVESFDPAGALLATHEEVHRFPVAPPRRYTLRRTAEQVREFGLDASGHAWARVDGIPRLGPVVETAARQTMWVWSVLSRAPFCLADPDARLTLAPDGTAVMATWTLAAGEERTAVFFAGAEGGRLARVVLQDPDMTMGGLMQSATAGAYREEGEVALVSDWALAPARLVDEAPGLTRERLRLQDVRSRNGFTDRLYGTKRP